jgi:hypothetical protein
MDIGSGKRFGDMVIGIGEGFGSLTDSRDHKDLKVVSANRKPWPVSRGGRETGHGV